MTLPGSKIRLSLEDFAELSREQSSLKGSCRESAEGISRTPKEPLWRGGFQVETLRQGLDLITINLQVLRDVELDMEIPKPAVGFILALEGDSILRMPGKSERVSSLPVPGGYNTATVCRPEKLNIPLRGGQWYRSISVEMDPGEIAALIDDQELTIPESLRPVLQPSKPWRPRVQRTLSPALECIAYQVLNCPFVGTARRLFMEGKALEILAHELHGPAETSAGVRIRYSQEDVERLEQARTILQQEYSAPPTILALSRRIGLNDYKLKRGFRELYDITIFGYIRELRMEKARALLESGNLNVTEVALTTGYSCLGHFAAAFKKRFGVLPNQYRSGMVTKIEPSGILPHIESNHDTASLFEE